MEEKSNSIIRCLSKTLNSEIKFITIVSIKYISSDNEIHKKAHFSGEVINNDKIFCLGEENIFILDDQMRKLEETFKYEAIGHIKKEVKPDCFLLFLKPGTKLKNSLTTKFLFTSKSRGNLLKNIMCYYSIYFMYKYASIKSLVIKSEENNTNSEIGNNNTNLVASNFHKIKQRTLNSYNFFIKGNILKEYNNHYFNIKYDQSLLTGKEIERELTLYTKECEVNIEIAEPVHMSYLDIERDFRDFSFYVNKMFIIYLKNTLKANRWWIVTNKIYQKKSNLTQDSCIWEGWKIEARITEPFNINVIAIFLRRSFLPPFYDSFQTIQITLTESYTKEIYTINPCAYRLIELIGNSIHSSQHYSIRTYQLFLKAKVDSLLVDEDTLHYLLACHQIIGDDVHKFGCELMQSIFRYIETTQLKDKIEVHKLCVENKIKIFKDNFEVERWQFKNKYWEFMAAIRKIFVDNITEEFVPIEQRHLITPNEINMMGKIFQNSEVLKDMDLYENAERTDGLSIENGFESIELNDNCNAEGKNKKENFRLSEEEILQKKHIWYSKVMRFIGYCLNGGLTDFSLTYEKFLHDIVSKIQTSNSDIIDLIYQTINFVNDKQIPKELSSNRDVMAIISSGNDLKFNENILAVCIKTGFLAKSICDNIGIFCKILNYILEHHCTNKILSNLWEYLKSIDEQSQGTQISGEKREYINIISSLVNIFRDKRRSVTTLVLSCKCLSILVSKDSDKINRIKLVEEADIINIIADLLNVYDYEEKLVLCCLELFSFVLPEASSRIHHFLYSDEVQLLNKLKKFLTYTDVPGMYYSQRVIIKVLTVLLNLTNITQAEIKENVSQKYQAILELLIRLVDEESKKKVIDPSEEESSILEYKVYWLLCILTFKNKISKEFILEKKFQELIEKKSEKYIAVIYLISNFKAKGGFSENKIIAISKNICKFFEFIYYLLIKDSLRISEFKNKSEKFNKLRLKIKESKDILMLSEKDCEVIYMIEKLYKLEDGYN